MVGGKGAETEKSPNVRRNGCAGFSDKPRKLEKTKLVVHVVDEPRRPLWPGHVPHDRLELREAVEGVSELFGDTPEKREFYRGIVHWAFLAVDRDKTGSLGVNGVIKLFETLVSMAPAE